MEILKVLEVAFFIVVIPTLILYFLAQRWPLILDISYNVIVAIIVMQAALSYWFTSQVFNRKKFTENAQAKHQPIPRTTFIVVAYLPNELEVIEDTLENILLNVDRPVDGIEVILVYNTPHMEDLELRLRQWVVKYPELILANAYNSRSKSENLNYAFGLATGEVIVILDSDHLVNSDCLKRAWRWLDEGYDVVQGRCHVRNGNESIISGTVEVEFEVIYGIQHASKSVIFDSTLFGGTNGYWKAQVIKKVGFREDMLTEDIDGTLRGILQGVKFVHDRSIISTELSPITVKGLWYQRKRWAQGWFQCALQYQIPVLFSKFLNIRQKFLWVTLLSWRVFYDVVSMLLFPVIIAFWLYIGKVVLPVNGFIIFAVIFTLANGPFQALAAYKNAAKPKAPMWRYAAYSLFVWPYTMFKSFVNLVAMRDELAGEKKWIVSKRDAKVK